MTKNSKAMRRVLCGVVSFLLSFFSCLFVMCLVFKFTVLSPSFLVGVEKRSDYAEALHSELKEQFVSYGSAGNVDESFFDSVFENIITPDRIDEDTKAVITDFYNGEVKDSIDTSDIQSEFETRLLEYAAEKGFAVDGELKNNIKDMAVQFGDLYNSYVSLFSNSYFKSAGNMLKRYNPYADYAAIIAVTLSLIAGLVLRMSYKKRKNVYRYYIYAFSGTALMLLAAPLAAIIGGVGTRINIGTKSLYSFASGFMTDTLWAFVFAAAAVAVVTAVFYALRRIFVKKNI